MGNGVRRIFWVGVLGVVFTLNGYVAMGQLVGTDPTPPRTIRGGTFEAEPENYRTIYFTGTAVSNASIDVNPFSNCIQSGSTWNCQLPQLKCRLSIVNLSPENIRQIVQISFNHQVVTQYIDDHNTGTFAFGVRVPNTSETFSGIDPFMHPFKDRVSITDFRVFPNTQRNTWLGTMERNSPLTLQPNDAPHYIVAPNQVLIIEQSIQIQYRHLSLINSARNQATLDISGLSPYLKAPIFCSGRISVKDAEQNQSGYVVAQGALDYFANSYLPTAYEMPAIVERPTLTAPAWLNLMQRTSGNASCTIAENTPSQITSVLTNALRTNSEAKLVGGINGNINYPNSRRLVSTRTNSIENMPRLYSADNIRVSSVPIMINGGSPF